MWYESNSTATSTSLGVGEDIAEPKRVANRTPSSWKTAANLSVANSTPLLLPLAGHSITK